jgi:RNA polymerase sigma-70 factor (ECF subfamily)
VENTDQVDINACLNGDADSYERLVRRYESEITAVMWRFTRDKSVCIELVQDVFVEAYFSLAGFKGKGPFLHWLKVIATRVGYKFWTRRGKERSVLSLDDIAAGEIKGNEPDSSLAGEVVYRLLSRLNKKERLVLTLMYLEGCSTEEIAQRMGWTRGAVKMKAYRARNKLKEIAEHSHILEGIEWKL